MGIVRLRLELRALRHAVNELYAAIKQHSEATYAAEQSERNKPTAAQTVQAVVSFYHETKRNTETENKKQRGIQSSIRFAAWFAFGAAIIYATIAVFQWCEMHKTTLQVTRQIDDFENAQRAVLTMKTYAVTGPIEVGKPLQLQCTIWNTGTTAARDISIVQGGGGGDASTFTRKWHGRIYMDVPMPANTIPRPSEGGETLGQNQTRDCGEQFGPLDSDTASGKFYIREEISVSYRDVFGKPWIINRCLIYQPRMNGFSDCQIKTDGKPN